MTNALFPPPTSEHNVVSYQLFVILDPTESKSDVPCNVMSDAREELARVISKISNKFLWHKHEFSLGNHTTTIEARNRKVGVFSGTVDVGEAILDEWLIVYIFREFSKRFAAAAVQITDTDGEFLLIEAAHALPSWITPKNSANRVFIRQGKLHIVDLEVDGSRESALEESLVHIFSDECNTTAAVGIQQCLDTKLSEIPLYVEENSHRTRCTLPLQVAQILIKCPRLLSPIVEAFYYREPQQATAICKKMSKFTPLSPTHTVVTLSRCMYAQLKQQEYYAPKPFIHYYSDTTSKAADLGIKLTCGLELLYHSEDADQWGRLWRDVIDDALLGSANVTVSAPSEEEDDDSWLLLHPDSLEEKLEKVQREQFDPSRLNPSTRTSAKDELTSIADTFKQFVTSQSGLEGVEGGSANEPGVGFDFSSFMEILKGDPSTLSEDFLSDDDEDDDDEGEDELGDDMQEEEWLPDEDLLLDEGMEELFREMRLKKAMDAEVQEATMGQSFTHVAPEESERKALDLDFNLVSNLLESLASQEGQAGPVSNILGELDAKYRKDESECERRGAEREVCIVDKNNEVIGKAHRSVMRYYNLPHRATYIIIKNSSGSFYVQRRTMIKDYCPGYLDPMSGGVVQYEESFEENAYREAKEEMGVDGVELSYLDTFFYEDERSRVWGGMFECTYDGELKLQEEEVDEVLVMTAEEILSRKSEFTPDGIFAFKHYLDLMKKNQGHIRK